ncbi:SipW-dependent-type signal peptide-containing protein [Cellulomonas wangsupingiae]|uniref:SipW-dependent-type signal peptide-containing protein n=1 Tax=Cellulomonas wangsupingiae TaxID=2968085 RepID=UPI001D0DC7C5|nr:SipW-dependent-type signal peptide-containing protein [Cellulomonas wangsupingiae]MCM0639755.1 SipW-dependent-type signal peptide-containing protein [Cellulomonas wangsupingiae]
MSGLRDRVVSLPTAGVLALTVALAALVGVVGGGTLALWRDVETVTAGMPAGVVVFGVGPPGEPGTLTDYATGPGDTVDLTFGPAAAATLLATGSVAVPVQVDALAQGHRGLRYTVTRHIAGGILGESDVRLVKVAGPAACTTTVAGPAAGASTPVPADYSDTRRLTSEYWCLVATFDPVQGTYDATASVDAGVATSGGATPQRVTDEDRWSASVGRALVPADEPTHRLTFTFTTFRPGR